MSIHCISFTHHSVPIELREKLSLDESQREELIKGLLAKPGIQGALALSTCNRLEFYGSIERHASDAFHEGIFDHFNGIIPQIGDCAQSQKGEECARHLIKVACGLDSQSLGETQILGQIKQAYQQAAQWQSLDADLHHLCQFVFYTAKRIRHDLEINRHPVSIAGTAVQLMRRLFPDIEDKNVLIIGAGSTGRIVAENLHKLSFSALFILNRTPETAAAMAQRFGAQHGGLDNIRERLAWADIIFSCIDSRPGIFGKGLMESVVRQRRHRPQLVLDLGVPRNFEPEIAKLDDVFLYNLDQIHGISRGHLDLRREKANQARSLIDHHVVQFRRSDSIKSSNPFIRRYRQSCIGDSERLLDEAVARAEGGDVREAMRWLLKNVRNKSMHLPTSLIKLLAIENGELLQELIESAEPAAIAQEASE